MCITIVFTLELRNEGECVRCVRERDIFALTKLGKERGFPELIGALGFRSIPFSCFPSFLRISPLIRRGAVESF